MREEEMDFMDSMLGGIDIKLLRKQKMYLLHVINTRRFTKRQSEYLEGILNLLDVITDFFADNPAIVKEWRKNRKRSIRQAKKKASIFQRLSTDMKLIKGK